MAFAHVINLLRLTADRDPRHGAYAHAYAQLGIDLFMDNTSPLPKASSKLDHYEAITGGADFMLALLRLEYSGIPVVVGQGVDLYPNHETSEQFSEATPNLEAVPMPKDLKLGPLLYENSLGSEKDIANWNMEGHAAVDFVDQWMTMYSPQEKSHHVLWCPENFPSDFIATFEVQNLNIEAGLCIVFFAAMGLNGEDVLADTLPKRDGTFTQYTKGKIKNYHISYYANAAHNKDRGHTNLRKNPGFNLATSGKIGIPTASRAVHRVTLRKQGGHLQMWVDGGKVIDWIDTDNALTNGAIGFRQMKWTRFRYRNFQVFALP